VYRCPQTDDEFALARRETSNGPGHTDFDVEIGATLEEDLGRRDLTVNAMALDQGSGVIVDPFGGLADIRRKVLRHVSHRFAEDPLRVLRTARFYATCAGFTVAPETIALMSGMVARGDLSALTPERVWSEARRALMTRHPERFVACLVMTNALQAAFQGVAPLSIIDTADRYGWPLSSRLAVFVGNVDDPGVVCAALKVPTQLRRHVVSTWALFTEASNGSFRENPTRPMRDHGGFASGDGRAFEDAVRCAMLVARDEHVTSDGEGVSQRLSDLETMWRAARPVRRSDVDLALRGPEVGRAITAEQTRRARAAIV
jgi:hypothetical protein